jgi:hypothetical protein
VLPRRTASRCPPDVHLPEPHPDPPLDIQRRRLPLTETSGPWIRSHARGYGPIFFGKSGRTRFDAPAGQFGVLYVAADIHGAFIETFGRRLGLTLLGMHDFAARELSTITTIRPFRLVDLTSAGLSMNGADSRLSSGSYDLSQRWALAFHEHSDQPDGILYRSRHDPSRLCAAIFDRASDALTATSLGSLADPHNTALLAELLDAYDYSLIVP